MHMIYFCAFTRSETFPKNARNFGVGRRQFDAGVTGLRVFLFSVKALEILHAIFNSKEKHHPISFTGFLFVFEILHMQKLVFVVTSAHDCKDSNFT